MISPPTRLVLCACVAALLAPVVPGQGFTDVTDSAGLGAALFVMPDPTSGAAQFMAGVAVADYDDDGWEDIFHLGGLLNENGLYVNQTDGTFLDVASKVGLDAIMPGSDAKWADWDDDGDLDLFVTTAIDYPFNGEPVGHRNVMYRNDAGTFTEIAIAAGVADKGRQGISFGDLDGDDRLDIVTATWGAGPLNPDRTWFLRNDGDGTFSDVTPTIVENDLINGFAPTIVDYDEDGDNDVFVCADFKTSRVYRNDGTGFTDITSTIIDGGPLDDENGMGSAFGDYDNDGDIDWFVSSEFAPPEAFPNNWPIKTGNRMWSNNGDGTFTDVTEVSGTRDGGWGWAADFGDFDNDGDLDLPHTNGYYLLIESLIPYFVDDTLRIFMNDGTGTYTDDAAALGVVDIEQGRGLSIFDYDHDGRLDFLVANNQEGLTLYRNEIVTSGTWLSVELRGTVSNSRAVGAKITLSGTGTPTQTRWVRCGDNYLSQSPYARFFGTVTATQVDLLIDWPSGEQTLLEDVATNQRLIVVEPNPSAFSDLGDGLAGTGGVTPQMNGTGTLAPSSLNQLDVEQGARGATMFLVVGLFAINAPFKGGTMVPGPDVPPIPIPLSGVGAASLPFTWPSGVPGGTSLFFQGWIVDVGGPEGYSATNALAGVTP